MGLYIPSAPVEEKGYKSMINLPDWLNIHNIIIKFKNRLKTGEFFSFLGALFQRRTRVMYTVLFENRAMYAAGRHHGSFLSIPIHVLFLAQSRVSCWIVIGNFNRAIFYKIRSCRVCSTTLTHSLFLPTVAQYSANSSSPSIFSASAICWSSNAPIAHAPQPICPAAR